MMEHKEGSEQAQSGNKENNTENTLDHQYEMLDAVQARLEDKRTEIDWQEEVQSITMNMEKSEDSELQYYGHNMTVKGKDIGCRIATVNAANACPVVREGCKVIERLIDSVIAEKIDIMIIHEPGVINPKEASAIRKAARDRETEAVIRTDGAKISEGVIVILGPAWRMLKTYDRAWEVEGKGHSKARLLQMNFESAAKGEKERRERAAQDGAPYIKEKLALFAIYGYSGKAESKESQALWETARKKIRALRQDHRHRFDTLVVAGDFNMCASTELDTDREGKSGQKEPEAAMLEGALEDLRVQDTFRCLHQKTRAITRIPAGQKAFTDAARRLDYICTNKEIVEHPSTRIGIRATPFERTDHLPVIMDIPTNCANLAEEVQPIWDFHEVQKLKVKDLKEITSEERDEFSKQWIEAFKKQGDKTLEEKGKMITQTMYEAAVGTVAEEVTLKYPKRARTTVNREGWGEKLDSWTRRIKGACNAIRRVNKQRNLDKLNRALYKARWMREEIPEGLVIDKLENLQEKWKVNRKEVKDRLIEQTKEIRSHLRKAEEKEKRERITKAVKRRNEQFNNTEDGGKGKGAVIGRIFRAAREHEELRWVNRDEEEGGGVASTHKEVGEVVNKFFTKWFQSRVGVEERWTSKEHLMRLDTAGMDEETKDFVTRCYAPEYEENSERSKKERWWEGIRSKIVKDELKRALKRSNSEGASGPSQIGVGILKLLNDEAIEILLGFYNECLEQGGIPDSLNRAILKLLPKSDKGLRDMNAVRPIALMENISKVFEQIIIGRILKVIVDNEVLDLAQYGALPKAGTAPPLRVLAEMMEDARVSGRELHWMVADLSKAFEAMEYWSQALSWKCLGLPHMCEVRNTEVRNTRINTRMAYYGIWEYTTPRIAIFDRILLGTFRLY